MRLATASGRRSQQPPDQTSAYRCGRSRLRRLGQPYQPSPRPEFFNGIGQERKPDPGYDQVRFAPKPVIEAGVAIARKRTSSEQGRFATRSRPPEQRVLFGAQAP
jgi:hypothetical protein